MLDELRTYVLLACVIASFVSVFLFCAGALMASERVRDAIVNIWIATTSRLESQKTPDALLLSRAVMAALFEGGSGFSLWKFGLLMLVVNSGAVLGNFLTIEVDMSHIQRDERLGLLSKEEAALQLDYAAEAAVGMLLLAPLYLIAWSAFDYFAYNVITHALKLSSTRTTYTPVIIGTFTVLLVSYLVPFALLRLGYAEGGPGLFYVAMSPLMPAMHSLLGFSNCWTCSLLSLPTGLSVTISSLLIATAIVLVRAPILLRLVANAFESMIAISGKRLQAAALNIGTAAGVLIVVLTWRSLMPSPTT